MYKTLEDFTLKVTTGLCCVLLVVSLLIDCLPPEFVHGLLH